MPTMIYPNAGALWLAGVVQAALAASTVDLFQTGSVVLTPATTQAELAAAIADYTGYAQAAITAWTGPLLSGLGGAEINSPMLNFAAAAPYTVTNTVQGWWLEDSVGTLVAAGDFPAPISFTGAGSGVSFPLSLVFGITPGS